MKKKIIYIINSLDFGGAENVVIDLCDNMDHEKFSVHIICLSSNIPLVARLKNKEQIKISSCYKTRNKFPWFSFNVFFKLLKILKDENPEVIHSHLWSIDCLYLSSVFFLKKKPKCVTTIHTSELHYTSTKFVYRFFRFIEVWVINSLNFTTIAISKPVLATCKKLKFKNTILVYNGIDTEKFKPLPNKIELRAKLNISLESKVLIFVSRYSPQKGHIFLLDAFQILLEDYPSLKLILVGNSLIENLAQIIESKGISENIIILEKRFDIPDLINCADIGVFPSYVEGFPLAFAELMSCGLPVVAANIPPIAEITNNGEYGILVQPKSVEGIVEGIKHLIEYKNEAEQLSIKGRLRVENCYSLRLQIESHEKIYL